MTELCPQKTALYDRFRRVTFRQTGTLTDEALAEQLSSQHQVLCIVNSRKAAQSIYALLPPVLFQKTIEVAREALGGGRDIAEPETMA